jgi:hypothetical protein
LPVDVADDVEQAERIQNFESSAGVGVRRRRGEPRVAQYLTQRVRRIRPITGAAPVLDLVNTGRVKHYHGPNDGVRREARSTLVPKLIHEPEVFQGRIDPEIAVPHLKPILESNRALT